jgi:hypothetical protein
MAAWLDGQPTNLPAAQEFPQIPALVSSGAVYWVTIYFQDGGSSPADQADAANWYGAYPNPRVAVMADQEQKVFDWLWPGGYPNLQVLHDDMTLWTYDRFAYKPALEAISQ